MTGEQMSHFFITAHNIKMEKDTSTDAAAVEAMKGTNGRYQWTKHLNINVIEDTTNGFINASKMCSMYGKTKTGQPKQFTEWKYMNKTFIAQFACTIDTPELMYVIVNGIDTIKGTYIHSELFPHVAEWCGTARYGVLRIAVM